MRKRIVSLMAASTLMAGAAACGSSGIDVGTTGDPPVEAPAGALPKVTGAFGEAATINLPSDKPTPLSTTVLTEGRGRVIAKGDLLIAHYTGLNWRDKRVFDESYGRGVPNTFPIGVGNLVPGWDEGLVGKKVGSRVLLVLPPDKGYGDRGNPAAGILGTDTLVFSIDLVDAIAPNASATGRALPPSVGLPTVTVNGGVPAITIPQGLAAPTKAVVDVLIQGAGPTVKVRQTVIVQYVGAIFSSGRVFDSSWQRGQPASFPIGAGRVIQGWDDAIVGARVGSRLLLVIPPGVGYGAEGNPQAGITGDDTLVFVVDIIAAI